MEVVPFSDCLFPHGFRTVSSFSSLSAWEATTPQSIVSSFCRLNRAVLDLTLPFKKFLASLSEIVEC